ncbi:MAG: hypothetical protein CMP23_17040 [Rickettsiales bacterium]|nr:hypothetical protein [Rickettsiales bacterium]
MRVLLISSYTMGYVTRTDISPPLSLLTIAASMRLHGHEPKLLDLNTVAVPDDVDREDWYVKSILTEIEDFKPGMVGINCMLTANFPFVRKAAQAIKAEHRRLPVAIGGIHPTLYHQRIIEECPEIDAIALGEGEEQAIAMCDAFEKKDRSLLDGVGSIAWRDDFGFPRISPRSKNFIENLDDFPDPAWDLVHLPDYFTDHSTWYNPRKLDIKMSVPIQSSRACPFDCNFCSAASMMGRGLRLRSAKRVVDEMQGLYEKHGLTYFGFVDDILTVNKKHILGICEEIVRRGLVFQFESFNGYNLKSLDRDIIGAMVEAGMVYAILPLEHGNDAMRTRIIGGGKRLPEDKIYQVREIYREHDLLTRAVFIMGFPEDTHDTLQDTYDMITKLECDINNVFSLIPFPGTKLFNQAVAENLFLGEMNFDDFWKGEMDLNALQKVFYIKPYNLDEDELWEWRQKFDAVRLYSERVRKLGRGKNGEYAAAI